MQSESPETNKSSPVDPAEINRAKRIAAGPLGQSVGRYPMQFAAPLALTRVDRGRLETVLSNGTATLVNLGGGPLIITADHVVRRFKERAEEGPHRLRVGNLDLHNWRDQVIDQDRELDLATIRLSDVQVPMINPSSDIEIAKSVCHPEQWPPPEVRAGDWLVMGGFPGVLRLWQKPNDYSFGSFNGGPIQVNDISANGMVVCGLDRDYWIVEGEFDASFNEFGGASGGPVFLYRDRQLNPFHLMGVICQYTPFDAILIRTLQSIRSNGTIIHTNRDAS